MPDGRAGPPDQLRGPAMSMDDVVRLSQGDREFLAHELAAATGEVLIAVDDIDRALKVKVAGRWSPPIGRMEHRGDAGRRHVDDLAEESRTLTRESTVHPLDCRCFACVDPADLR